MYRRLLQNSNLSSIRLKGNQQQYRLISSTASCKIAHPQPQPTRDIPSQSQETPSSSSSSSSPLGFVTDELASIGISITSLLGSNHPTLDRVAKYYSAAPGKRLRPAVVLLLARATNGLAPDFEARLAQPNSIDNSLEPPNTIQDINPDIPSTIPSVSSYTLSSKTQSSSSSSSSSPSSLNASTQTNQSSSQSSNSQHLQQQQQQNQSQVPVLPTQRRLAEITEMIHVASLMHDDVVDSATHRRSLPSAPAKFGNKVSVLAGDFLLGRASLALSRLGSLEVVELMASTLTNLIEGEVMQLRGQKNNNKANKYDRDQIWNDYMQKTYLKTASLIAKSARSSVTLGGCGSLQGWAPGDRIKDLAYDYGKHLGLAFQLVDDTLDITGDADVLGKPSEGADLKLGLATAPTLYAWEQFPHLGELIMRDFSEPGDAEKARELVVKSEGVARTLELAGQHASKAREALDGLPQNEYTNSLRDLTYTVLSRNK